MPTDLNELVEKSSQMFGRTQKEITIGGTLFIETANIYLDNKFVKPYNAAAGDYVKIFIRDSGIGMDEDTLKMVFDPFFTTKEKERGTGLGLASAYGITKSHDGIITAQSEKGQGAAFNIYLPVSKKEIVT